MRKVKILENFLKGDIKMRDGIFGWDLPPGCSVNDIPGNRPEDAEWEKLEAEFWSNKNNCSDELWDKFEQAKLSDSLMDIVTKAIDYGMELGRKEQAQSEKS